MLRTRAGFVDVYNIYISKFSKFRRLGAAGSILERSCNQRGVVAAEAE
jgi:hypothetical protein